MKKIFAIVVALTMVFALSISVFAVEGSDEFKLTVGESETWVNKLSDAVTISGIGVYTFTISGLSFDGANMTVLYLKDAAGADADANGGSYDGPSTLTGATIYTKSIKINGERVALSEGYPTGTTDAGIYDICWFNIWGNSYFEAYNGTVNDIEVVIEVVNEGDPPSAEAEGGPNPENVDFGIDETDMVLEEEAKQPTYDENGNPMEGSGTSTAPKTGIALAVVPAVMALAAVAVTKKH